MKNISLWQDNLPRLTFPKLNEDKECDVLIIGGGITGISAYYHLKNSKLKVILVEQNKVGMATTSRSTGKLSFMQNDLIDKIRNNLGDEIASKYLKSQIEAINLVTSVIKKEQINCDLLEVESEIFSNQKKDISKIKDLASFLEKNNIKAQYKNNSLVKNKINICANNTYLFHPIKFLYGLVNGAKNIYENTSIIKINQVKNQYLCYTNQHLIKTKWIILASHYPYFTLPYFFPLKSKIEKSFLCASKSSIDRVSLISYSNPFISIRTYQDYLVFLSNSHTINMKTNDLKNFNELFKKNQKLDLKPEYVWSNNDIMTNDGMPYIGEIKEHLLLSTGYNTWGLAMGFLSGKILKDIIYQQPNEYIELFNPKRLNIAMLGGELKNTFINISGYLSGMKKQKDVKETKNTLIYQGHEVIKKCPHMGCNLLLNELEETWDCPCHGSRFSLDGKVINAPANKDIKKDV